MSHTQYCTHCKVVRNSDSIIIERSDDKNYYNMMYCKKCGYYMYFAPVRTKKEIIVNRKNIIRRKNFQELYGLEYDED